MTLFEQITVDMTTGAISYPKLDGFELDTERVYRTFERFLPYCQGVPSMALKHAIHEQLTAHQGAQSLMRGMR